MTNGAAGKSKMQGGEKHNTFVDAKTETLRG